MPTRPHNILKSISSPLPPVQSLDHIVPRQLYHYSCPGRRLSDSSAFLSPCLSVSQCKTSPSTQRAHCCRGRVWQTKDVQSWTVKVNKRSCTLQLVPNLTRINICKQNQKKHPSQILKSYFFLTVMNFIFSWIERKWWIQNGRFDRFLNYLEIFTYTVDEVLTFSRAV